MEPIRKESTDAYNRLHSIERDAKFVESVLDAYPDLASIVSFYRIPRTSHRPNVRRQPNLRSGEWYLPPERTTTHAYFKSTDGHTGQWSFSLRRANLHLLPIIEAHGGAIIVDSTRRGKHMPDALSKTIPIWCAVLNRAVEMRYKIFGTDASLFLPPGVVGPSEVSQIEARIDGWVNELLNSAYALPKLGKPLRPLWIHPATRVLPTLPTDCLPLICLSASSCEDAGIRRDGYCYVQGSGDDHELWSDGLTAALFWKHKDRLLAVSRADLGDLVPHLVGEGLLEPRSPSNIHPVQQTGGRLRLLLGSMELDLAEGSDWNVIQVSTEPGHSENGLCRLELPTGKLRDLALLNVLPEASAFASKAFCTSPVATVVVRSPDVDAAIAVALVILVEHFDENGMLLDASVKAQTSFSPSKAHIQLALQRILSSIPPQRGGVPARSTLKRVNEVLLSPPGMRSQRRGPAYRGVTTSKAAGDRGGPFVVAVLNPFNAPPSRSGSSPRRELREAGEADRALTLR